MDLQSLTAELIELATAYQTGAASDDERARLERLLEDDAQARAIYLRIADDTVTLNDIRPSSLQSPDAAGDSCLACDLPTASAPRRALRRWPISGAVAACAACLGLWFWQQAPPLDVANVAPTSSSAFARVLSLSSVEWRSVDGHFQEWQRIKPGDAMKFGGGSVEVLYDNGVQFVVQGPADLTFDSEKVVTAEAGKLVARVSPEAIGFKIITPHAAVIDRGTAFGMTIDPERQTDVVVYEGKVDLSVGEAVGIQERQLAAGEGMRIDRDGKLGRISSVAADAFLPPPRLSEYPREFDGRIIASVGDNLKSSQTSKYYRVINHGFAEDCQAFVDRHHQWNGVDGRGIPAFLENADYVMTFNDDKVNADLGIAVKLAQPARLYVLLDDRAQLPKWLAESFIDTGWKIGIDEGYDDVAHVKTAIGAGKSIENVCSVWMKEVLTPSVVLLGSLRETAVDSHPRDVELAMYGIAASPLPAPMLGGK